MAYAITRPSQHGDGGGQATGLPAGETRELISSAGKNRRINLFIAATKTVSVLVQIYNTSDDKWTTADVSSSSAGTVSDSTQSDTNASDSSYVNRVKLQDYVLPSKARVLIKNTGVADADLVFDVHIHDALNRG